MKWNKIVDEQVNYIEQGVKPLVTEMSISIGKYQDKVDGIVNQLIENWCLCKYCHMFELDNRNFNHWQNELYSTLTILGRYKLKSGNKKDILTDILIDEGDLNDYEIIVHLIGRKFKKEGISDKDTLIAISKEFAKEIGHIIDVVCDGEYEHYAEVHFTLI